MVSCGTARCLLAETSRRTRDGGVRKRDGFFSGLDVLAACRFSIRIKGRRSYVMPSVRGTWWPVCGGGIVVCCTRGARSVPVAAGRTSRVVVLSGQWRAVLHAAVLETAVGGTADAGVHFSDAEPWGSSGTKEGTDVECHASRGARSETEWAVVAPLGNQFQR